MPFSVVSDGFRQQLEQERSRLMEEREAIIEAAIAQATAEIDQTIENLNNLLGGALVSLEVNGTTEPSKKTASKGAKSSKATAQSDAVAKAPTKARAKAKPAAPAAKAPSKAIRPEPRAKATSEAEALPLKRQFKGMTPTQATYRLLEESPEQTFSTDEVIAALFSSLNEAQQAAARKSIGLVLGRGTYQGKLEKVQENPNLFKFKPQDGEQSA